MTSKIIDESG